MALPNMEFWAWLKHIGAIQGDANYYSSGQAGAEEYENALRVAYKYLQGASDPRVMGQFWEYLESMGAIQGDPTYYSSGQAQPEEFDNAFKVSTEFFASGGGTDAYVPTKPGAPPEENKAEKGVGGAGPDPETRLTILTSNDMKWYFDKGSGRWYVSYGLPNGTKQLLFEADPDQMDALFGEGMRPSSYETVTTKALLARDSIVFAGNVAEMEGTGSFEAEFEKVIAIAKNNGQLPSWMQGDPKALDLIFIAQTENKSNDWLVNEFSKLDSFKARFPGIQKLQTSGNMTLIDAIGGFLEYEAGVKQAANALGLTMADVTPDVIGGLLGRGWSLQDTLHAMQNFKRQQDFAPALDAFNQILAAKGMAPLSTQQELFDFMDGKAPAEYYDIYEASSVAEAATQAGLGDIFSAQDAINAALAGDFDRGSAMESMQKAAQLLLRLRAEVATEKYGITQDELIDISLGLAPSSGRSEVEVFEAVNRATLEAQARLKNRVRPFQGFTPQGRVQAQSLSALRNES